jgi:hypothetical protein
MSIISLNIKNSDELINQNKGRRKVPKPPPSLQMNHINPKPSV